MNKNHSVDSSILKPQLLFSIPSTLNIKPNVLNNQFLFAFPNGIDISYYEEPPKIYSIVLTNEKGIHSYFYILLFYDKISDSIEIKNNLNRNSNAITSEMHYCPISIIISTYYSNLDFFRNLLINIYKIIKFDYSILINSNSNTNSNEKNSPKTSNSINSNIDNEKIKSFQKIELLNYLYFCYQLPRPPNKSLFSLNTRFDRINYKFLSLAEIPTNDYCIDILFNTLEYSVIIKLFIALLFEKHIILIANQNMPLFCICESLRFLLFPLRWLHLYIPNLPYEQISYLDSPMPYLIGINTTKTNAQDLINTFPSHIICEVGTSTLYGNVSNLKLPFNEEMKIKTKLLLLKSKYKNNYDELDIEGYSYNSSSRSSKNSNMDEYEDVDFNLSFAQNVQNIFFRIFKNSLKNFKKEYIINNIFNSQNFLNSFENDEYKSFFEKIIKTYAFENFMFSMKYLDDSASRKFNLICKNDSNKNLKENNKQSKYYRYSFNIPKKINKFFNINDFQDTYDEYTEISNMLEENYLKSNNSLNNSNKFSKSSYFMSKSNNRESKSKVKYNYLNFYGKDGFISFAINNQNCFNYKNIIKNEILNLYKEIINTKNNEHFFGNSSTLLFDFNKSNLYNQNKKNKNFNSNNISSFNDNIISNNNENIIDAPLESCGQLYLLIGTYLYIANKSTLENKIKNGNSTNKLSKIFINENNNITNNNNNITNNNNSNNKNNRNNNYPLVKYDANNSNNLDSLIKNHNQITINNLLIFKIFLIAFRKNQNEFPRNLFFMTLNKFSLEELKKIGKTNLKYIDKSIQCQIRKIEKITYKELVISNDSDNDDISEEGSLSIKNMNSIIIVPKLNSNDRKRSLKNLKDVENLLNLEEEQEEKNVQKTKLNVVESVDSTYHNGLNGQQNQNTNNIIRRGNIKKKTTTNLNSWNCIDLENYTLRNSLNDNINNQINLNVDPMVTSEQICTKLYLFLSSMKIENFNEKNFDSNFFKNLAHSDEINELKDLILSLKYISIENLSLSPRNYYCFWLNMYNFLTIFAVIYKCEIISNYYEWYRFLKNSYFTIGNVEISLYEIENFILRDKLILDNIYGKIINNIELDLPKIEKFDPIINFGISLPTVSSPSIRMYFPMNFVESLKFNSLEFFSRSLGIDFENKTIQIPEYTSWIDPNFVDNIDKYKDCIPKEFLNYYNSHKMKIKIIVEKYDWKLSYVNFKNSEINI